MPFDWPESIPPALRRLAPAGIRMPAPRRPDWTRWPESWPKLRAPRSAKWGITLALLIAAAVVVFLVLFDWNWFKPSLERVASARTARVVKIDGDLDAHPWSLSPSAEIHDLRIARPAWEGKGDMVTVDRVAIRIKLLPLFRGQQVFELLSIEGPDVKLLREQSGRANWKFGAGPDKGPLKLPAIQHLIIEDGKLRIDDRRRNILFVGTVSSSERTVGPDRGVFMLEGKGSLNREPFYAKVTGDPLLNVSPDRPYPFKAEVRSGATRAYADASITRPFDLSRFGGALTVSGADLNDLFPLTGLALPNTPPYRINGNLKRTGSRYDFNGFTGTVGDSDLRGDLYVETGGERIYLNGDMRSRRLDFDDLGSLFGGRPGTGPGETAAPEQRAMSRRLFPTSTLQVERIRAMDADVNYRADAVNAPRLPLRKVRLDMKLKDGVLTADPMSFDLTRGSIAGRAKLDASRSTPRTDVDVRMTNARLEDFIRMKSAGGPPISGVMAARAKLTGYGNSVAKAVATADGQVTVVVPNGTIRQAFAELLGINLARGLFMLLDEDPKQATIRCAVADFRAVNGVLVANRLIMDTDVVLAKGSGTISLKDESMNLRIDGDSKKPRLVRLLSPITIRGSLLSPKLGIEAGPTVAQAGIGLALGVLLTPLAAILPFVEPGLAENADCAALEAGARSRGAPTKVNG